MGYIRHDAVLAVVSSTKPETMPDVEAFRRSLPEEWRRLVIGPIDSIVNSYALYAFLPDGSKEWWDTSDVGDRYREQFRALFSSAVFPDVLSVAFGGDYGDEFGATTEVLLRD